MAAIDYAIDEGRMEVNLSMLSKRDGLRGAAPAADDWEKRGWGKYEEVHDPLGNGYVLFKFSEDGFQGAKAVVERLRRRSIGTSVRSLPWTGIWAFIAALAALATAIPTILNWFQ